MAEKGREDGAGMGVGGEGEKVAIGVAEKLAKMGLTAKENMVLVMEDEENPLKFAVVGKVLSGKKFHIHTIDSALRPQWGNPRDLTFTAKGDNVFMASMDFERDRKRIWDGAPWTVSKHVVVLDDFDMSMKPSEIKFKRLLIWFRCEDLPFNWVNKVRGQSIAEQVGEFIYLDFKGTVETGWTLAAKQRKRCSTEESSES
ncbi:hypothetical protein ACQ4PT_036613 [Festuca glaucescens]